MKPWLQSSDHLRHRQRTALLGAALIIPFAFIDAAQPGTTRDIAIALAARASWFLSLLGGVALLRKGLARTATLLMAASTVTAPTVIIAATGGTRSGYFPFLMVLSFCMVVLLPGHVVAAVVSGMAGVVAGAVFLHGAGASATEILRWCGTGAGSAALALYATHVGGVLLYRELASAIARAESSAALANSERRRATVERLALVGRLAAGVAHEINNPLAYVKANLAFVRDRLEQGESDRPELEQALDDSVSGVDRIHRIVADLRGFARADGDEPCGASVGESVMEATRISSVRTRGIRVDVDVPSGLPPVRICRKRLVQVLVNLVVNAADAVLAEGIPPERRWIAVSAVTADGFTEIRVEDGGPGLSERALAHLFEPFFTTKPVGSGTGLGLALSREYVTSAGGDLGGFNGPRGGAVFRARLPSRSGGAGCSACRAEDPAASGHLRAVGA